MRSRGIRFPGRDNESLAPIFTPPRSTSVPELPHVDDLPHEFQRDVTVQGITPEQTKEAFDVARNSVELLSTVLSSSPQQDVLEVSFFSCSVVLLVACVMCSLDFEFFNCNVFVAD